MKTSNLTRIIARFEIFMVVTMKNGALWDVMPCGSCKNQHFGGLYQGGKNRQLKHATKKE
jgi:hypothetical protein